MNKTWSSVRRVVFLLGLVTIVAAGCDQPSSMTDSAPEEHTSQDDGQASSRRSHRAAAPEDLQSVDYGAPLVVEEGGSYSGAWESQQPDTPAVTIATSEPVVIESSYLRGRGDLIKQGVDGVDLTIRDSYALGLNPDKEGGEVGRFVNLENASNVVVEHNYMESTSGIRLLEFTGDAPEQTIKIIGNAVRNIDGRLSNGSGEPGAAGFYEDDGDDSVSTTQFVQFDKVRDVAGVEIAWNDVLNEPDKSRVEDNVSIFLSSGIPGSPIRIHNNFIEGAYPLQPEEEDYSGGGIMLGDGDVTDPADASAYVEATSNTVVNTTNYGIAIASGHHLSFRDNRILSSGRLPNGKPVAGQNVGAYVWAAYGDSTIFFDNEATDNLVGWETPLEGGRNDLYMPDADREDGNRSFTGSVTQSTLDAEYDVWLARAQEAGIAIGPRG